MEQQAAEITQNQKLFNVADAAHYLRSLGAKNTTVRFIRALIVSGQLAQLKIGKSYFVTKIALDAWLHRSEKKRRT